MEMKTKLFNRSSFWEHLIKLFTHFRKEDKLSQGADVEGTVKIKRNNLVTSVRAWFIPSSRIIFVSSWMLDACPAKSVTYTDFSLHLFESNLFLFTSQVENASIGKDFVVRVWKLWI